MSPTTTKDSDLESGKGPGMCYSSIWPVLADFIMPITGGKHDDPQSTADQPTFGDSSGLLFSMYSKAAEDEDNNMVEGWKKDAEGILIFVSPCVGIHIILCMNWNVIDRSILCCSCCTPRCDHPGPETRQSGYLRILSWEHL